MENMKAKFEGKRPTNKQMYEILEEGYNEAIEWTKDNNNKSPQELICLVLNTISYGLNKTSETHDIDFLLSSIATYLSLFKFGEKKKRTIFEKTMASFSDHLNEKDAINCFEFLRILLDHTKKLV